MKLTAKQILKVVEVTTAHDYPEKYMVLLKEGYSNSGEEVGFFNTQKEVKEFINNAEKDNGSSTIKVSNKGTEIVPYFKNFLLYVDGKSVQFATTKEALFQYAKENGIAL